MINPRLIEISPDIWVRVDRIVSVEQAGTVVIVTTTDGRRHPATSWPTPADLAHHILEP